MCPLLDHFPHLLGLMAGLFWVVFKKPAPGNGYAAIWEDINALMGRAYE